MKKAIVYLLTIIFIFSAVIGLVSLNKKEDKSSSDKVKIIATIFPQYDFAKQVGGDKVDVSLLLTPGTETHTYEPTPQDIINVNKSDLFIYTGENMEPWAHEIAEAIDSNTVILDASKNIDLKKSAHNHDEEDEDEHHEDSHDEEDDGDDDEHEHNHHVEDDDIEEGDGNHEGEHYHHHEFDPHIWLNPQNAIVMVKNIEEDLCKIDSENEAYYRKNAEEYIASLRELDEEIEQTVNSSKTNKVAFGGTFAYMYFLDRYNLEYVTAYDSCGEDTEPSVANVKKVIDYINENKLHVVFYQEQSAGKIADSISKETGAEKLVFHTLHNVSPEELKNGEGYISIMKKNLENLKKALN